MSQHQVGWDLEDDIRQEEDACSQAIGRRGQSEILIHRQRCEADIHPVEISDEVTDDQKGDEANRYPCHRALFERVHWGDRRP